MSCSLWACSNYRLCQYRALQNPCWYLYPMWFGSCARLRQKPTFAHDWTENHPHPQLIQSSPTSLPPFESSPATHEANRADVPGLSFRRASRSTRFASSPLSTWFIGGRVGMSASAIFLISRRVEGGGRVDVYKHEEGEAAVAKRVVFKQRGGLFWGSGLWIGWGGMESGGGLRLGCFQRCNLLSKYLLNKVYQTIATKWKHSATGKFLNVP